MFGSEGLEFLLVDLLGELHGSSRDSEHSQDKNDCLHVVRTVSVCVCVR